jgi:hypothetical protein
MKRMMIGLAVVLLSSVACQHPRIAQAAIQQTVLNKYYRQSGGPPCPGTVDTHHPSHERTEPLS